MGWLSTESTAGGGNVAGRKAARLSAGRVVGCGVCGIGAVGTSSATGLGDIGSLFPDSDPQWQGADSIGMLSTVVGMLRGPVVNVDVTVVCEEPKLAPYRTAIVALLEGVTSARVSVKAATNEGMGWIGRGEGIAAIAVASVDIE